jgi:hypothetical protein
VGVAVKRFQPCSRVGETDPFSGRAVASQAIAIVLDLQREFVPLAMGPQFDLASARVRLDSMADGVFDKWLHDQVWNLGLESFERSIDLHVQTVSETDLLDVEITLQKIQLPLERNLLRLAAVEGCPQQFA